MLHIGSGRDRKSRHANTLVHRAGVHIIRGRGAARDERIGHLCAGCKPLASLESAPVYPVSIHEGKSEAPIAQPVGRTSDPSVVGLEGENVPIGTTGQLLVLSATQEDEGTLEDLTGAQHVVVIHNRSERYGAIVACSEISGYDRDGVLAIPMRAISDEEVDTPVDLLDDAVKVIAYLVQGHEQHTEVQPAPSMTN